GCWSTLRVRTDAPIQIQFVVANIWTGGTGTWRQHTRIIDPDGGEIARSEEAEFDLTEPTKNFRADQRFALALHRPGIHGVEVYLGDDRVLHYSFTVELTRPR